MEFLTEYGLFLAKAVTVVIAIAIIVGIASELSGRGKKADKGHIAISKLNEFVDDMRDTLQHTVLSSEQQKAEKKKRKQQDKERKKSSEEESRKRVFVLSFKGDISASESNELREAITAVLAIAQESDEVVVKLESPGGAVHGYGLAASQLDRIRNKNIPLTICVDKVAASGGYMMACVGDRILSAPFAMIGSIGVIGQLPNFSKLLKKHDVEFEQHTAGDYKRTLTMFGENTDEDRAKFREDLQQIHDQFKHYVAERRPQLDIEKVATGEVWLGSQALKLGLVDEVKTSDEYLTSQLDAADLYEVSFEHKKRIQERLGLAASTGVEKGITGILQRIAGNRFFS